jgi:uncharacterized short protein YbdD (DUF466 family)
MVLMDKKIEETIDKYIGEKTFDKYLEDKKKKEKETKKKLKTYPAFNRHGEKIRVTIPED